MSRFTIKRWLLALAVALTALILVAAWYWRGDIHAAFLDPGQPFQTYDPPPSPDYARPESWAQLPAPSANDPPVDVFFIHPTTFDGGRDWNGPIDDEAADRVLSRVMLPNYAGPFHNVGRVFTPRYRQASLYSMLTSRDDAREARAFAYEDVARAFDHYLRTHNQSRPLILVGVEQGGFIAERLLIEMPPAVRQRLVAAYVIETAVPADRPPAPPCAAKDQVQCLVAWISVTEGEPDTLDDRLRHSLRWQDQRAAPFGEATPVCVNPVAGVAGGSASAQAHLGGVNATRLAWDERPAFLAHQVSTQCRDGILHIGRARSASVRLSGSWAEETRAKPFNMFYADIEADAQARTAAYLKAPPALAEPLRP